MKLKKTRTLLFCPTEPLPWIIGWSPRQNFWRTENLTQDYPCAKGPFLTVLTMRPWKPRICSSKQATHYNQNAEPSKKPLESVQPIHMYDHYSQTWGVWCHYKARQTVKVWYHQIQQYRCHLSKTTVPTETRYNCTKWPTTPTDRNTRIPRSASNQPGLNQPHADVTEGECSSWTRI